MAEAKFYTYVHRTADTGSVFYVGKGKGQRAYTKFNRTKFWTHVASSAHIDHWRKPLNPP